MRLSRTSQTKDRALTSSNKNMQDNSPLRPVHLPHECITNQTVATTTETATSIRLLVLHLPAFTDKAKRLPICRLLAHRPLTKSPIHHHVNPPPLLSPKAPTRLRITTGPSSRTPPSCHLLHLCPRTILQRTTRVTTRLPVRTNGALDTRCIPLFGPPMVYTFLPRTAT
jgi:hypothetical protein